MDCPSPFDGISVLRCCCLLSIQIFFCDLHVTFESFLHHLQQKCDGPKGKKLDIAQCTDEKKIVDLSYWVTVTF